MIRILHVVSIMDVGGMESFIMNIYRHIDRSKIQFDFLVHHKRRGVFEDEIEELGGHVYHTSVIDDGNLIKYKHALKNLFLNHPEYRIIHGHLGSTAYWYLGEAERQGVPWRILHSHVPAHIHSLKGDIKHILFYLSPIHANINLACSKEAGVYQFKKRPFEIIPNGIDVARFRFSEQVRNETRARLGLSGRFVIGHVGRFYYEKNHPYILNIFSKVKEQIPDAALLLIGDGPLLEQSQENAKRLGIDADVLFLGLQKDTSPYYQAMDAFFLPSLYEGLPLAGIEAQCAGLPCLFTANASDEVRLSEKCYFIPIGEENIHLWVEKLKMVRDEATNRMVFPVKAWDYDVEHVAQNMAERYTSLLSRQA